jgi:hypothetical protein
LSKKIDWELTATTIYCDAVEDEVTLIINKDGTARCTGIQKYLKPDRETAREMKEKSKKLEKTLACDGDDCRRISGYRDSLLTGKN